MESFTVSDGAGERLDVYLAQKSGLTRSQIKILVDEGNVIVNNRAEKCGKKLAVGDVINLNRPQKQTDLVAQDIPLDVIYEDEFMAVINKQRGLSVHPAGGAVTNTLVNALLHRYKSLSTLNGGERPGIVHRLDKDTTGLILIAKTDAAHLSLSRQFSDRRVTKIYLALLDGIVKDDSGEVCTKIARSSVNRKKMAVVSGAQGRQAVTKFTVLERLNGYTFAQFNILTGRTHQIRVHAKHIGHPVTGDALYGAKSSKFNLHGQLLHAYSLTVNHPDTGKNMTFTAPLPIDFAKILHSLGSKYPT